jgi:glycerophosphoryl diester phosphodiesterase
MKEGETMTNKMSWLIEMKIAHRGYHSPEIAPENSIRAFRNAIGEGFDIELDVHILKDNNIVVFHDDNLERMTGYKKNIEECTYDEIKSLKLFNTEEKISLFSEVLSIVSGQVPLMIELKNRGKVGRLEQKLYDLLKIYPGGFAVQSFNPYSMGWFRKNAPDIIRGQLSGSYKNEHIEFYKKVLLENLILKIISKPHFVNYEIGYLSNLVVEIQKHKKLLVLGWTAKNKVDYEKAMKQTYSNVSFIYNRQ